MCFINTSCSVCNKKHELSEAEGHFVRPDLGEWILKKRGHFQWHKSELMKLLHLISLDWHSLNKLPVLHCIEHWTFIPHHMSVIVCGPSTPGTRCFPIVLSKTPGWKRIGPFLKNAEPTHMPTLTKLKALTKLPTVNFKNVTERLPYLRCLISNFVFTFAIPLVKSQSQDSHIQKGRRI